MSTGYVGLVFGSKYVQFRIICLLQDSINTNTVDIHPPNIAFIFNGKYKEGANLRTIKNNNIDNDLHYYLGKV